MTNPFREIILDKLCPSGNWRLSGRMESLLKSQILRLPAGTVSETETRYPTSPVGMRAFLDTFFARHFFQVQDSLVDYLGSDDFLDSLRTGRLLILDIGSGPAVACLAITEIVACILQHDTERLGTPDCERVKVTYVLNDTSGICLGTGQIMLNNYLSLGRKSGYPLVCERMIPVQTAFPDNIRQLQRISHNIGTFDIINLCYVLNPLYEEQGFESIVGGISGLEKLCCQTGQILILQDRFSASLIQKTGRYLKAPVIEAELRQQVYSNTNDNDFYLYTYCRCLYAPKMLSMASQTIETSFTM